MATVRRQSLVWRLVALTGGAFAATALVVMVIVGSATHDVVLETGRKVYEQRTERIVRTLQQQQNRLHLTGQPAAYRSDFQESTLRSLDQLLLQDQPAESFPFVVDRDGNLLLHPERATGRQAFAGVVDSLIAAAPESGSFTYTDRDGREMWVIHDSFAPWGWTVGYQVPERALLADAMEIRRALVIVWVAVTALVLLLLVAVLRREVRPLQRLTQAAAAMAQGDLDRDVPVDRSGEVGVLADAFVEMRAAIRRQLAELRESESRYRRIFDAMADGLLLLDQDGVIVAANPRVAAMYGWAPRELQGRPVQTLLRDEDDDLARQLVTPPADRPLQLAALIRDREDRVLETALGAVRLSFHGRPHALVILRDVTEQRRLERQLLQSQKLESVGRLAGGVAHDFNNLLTPVLGYSEMLLTSSDLPEDARGDLESIRRAGERARNLARQLLAFSRRQVLELRDLNLGRVVRDFEPILRRTLREDIDLVVTCQDQGCNLRADLGQIEQIIMNLAINAMDAMPDGGRIELVTSRHTLDGRRGGEYVDVAPGNYTRLAVLDSGPGVPEELLDRIFEPFFTTKAPGKGTGLGLSTIHGIVRQHGGTVALRNRPGGGCEVEVLLPCSLSDCEPGRTEHDAGPRQEYAHGSGETVVLVEDDTMVRNLVETLLTKSGYRVRTYPDGRTCLQGLLAEPKPADLLLTDVIMPGLNGPNLRDRLREAGFQLPVLFMSGYAGETLVRQGLADARADFLQKPLKLDTLLARVRDMLAPTRGAGPVA